tara:strand:- start:950 stop:1234 length:285 start_codon:yes stop_codon:yes gene_type:complete
MIGESLLSQNHSQNYIINIEKNQLLGLVLEFDPVSKSYIVDEIINEKLRNEINIGDYLVKINDIDISNYNTSELSNLCKKLMKKKKVLEFVYRY